MSKKKQLASAASRARRKALNGEIRAGLDPRPPRAVARMNTALALAGLPRIVTSADHGRAA